MVKPRWHPVLECPGMRRWVSADLQLFWQHERDKKTFTLIRGEQGNRTQGFGPSEGKRNTEQTGVCGGQAELGVLQGPVFSFYTPGRADWGEGPRPPSSLCRVYLSCLMCAAQESNMSMSKNVLFRFYSMPHVCGVHVPVSVCLKWIVCLCVWSVNESHGESVWVCAQYACFKTTAKFPELCLLY